MTAAEALYAARSAGVEIILNGMTWFSKPLRRCPGLFSMLFGRSTKGRFRHGGTETIKRDSLKLIGLS